MVKEQKIILEEQVARREQEFHDSWADSIDPAEVQVVKSFTGTTSPEGAWILKELGSLKGCRILELGSGAGEGAVYFASQGAQVVATDLSPGMLGVARKVAALHGVQIQTVVASANDLSMFPRDFFDIVYAANLLHHVDIALCLDQVRRVLKPGGRAAFWDPVAHNPVINVYRAMATNLRTSDEHPIRRRDLDIFRERFAEVNCQFFWLMALVVFLKFFLVDGIHPSANRYWKLILIKEEALRTLVTPLMRLDRILLKLVPFLGWWCWNIGIIVRK